MQSEIAHWVKSHCRRLGLDAFVELPTRISSKRYRVPDVVIIEAKRRQRGVLETAPLVAIEILSPEDRLKRVQERIDDYLSIGTRFVWVIDPVTRRAWVHTATAIEEVKDGILRVDAPSFTLPLRELFESLDQMPE